VRSGSIEPSMRSLHPSPTFLRRTRELIAAHTPMRAAGRSPASALRRAWRWLGNPFVLAFALISPGFISAMDPGPRHFSWSVLLFLGIASVANLINAQIFQHPHLQPFAFLPVDPRQVLRRQGRTAARLIGILSVAGGIGFAFAAARLPGPHDVGSILLAGALVTALFPALAIAYALAAQRSAWLATPLAFSFPVTVLLMILLRSSSWTQERVVTLLNAHGDLLSALLPTGWIVLPWSAITGRDSWHRLAALVPLVPLVGTLPMNLRWLSDHYSFRESILLNLFLEAPENSDDELIESVANAQQSPSSRGETAIVDDILARWFLASGLAETPGRIERMIWTWWTPRERVVAEFLRPEWPDWSGRWRMGSIVLACTIPISVTLGLWMPEWLPVSFIGYACGALYLLPVSAGFTLHPVVMGDSGVQSCPIHSVPIRLAEVASLQWKAAVTRSLAALPVSGATGALAVGMQGGGYGLGGLIGIQVALIWCAIRPGVTVYRFQSINRTWMKGPVSLIGLGFVALVLLLNLVGLIAAAVPFAGLAAVVLLLPLNYGALRWVCFLLDRHGIDAVRPVTPP